MPAQEDPHSNAPRAPPKATMETRKIKPSIVLLMDAGACPKPIAAEQERAGPESAMDITALPPLGVSEEDFLAREDHRKDLFHVSSKSKRAMRESNPTAQSSTDGRADKKPAMVS